MISGAKRKNNDESSVLCKKKEVARQRWRILAETLNGKGSSETQQSAVSVRRFQSYGLLHTHQVEDPVTEENDATWYQYTCPTLPHLTMKIRHVKETIRPQDLLGFNNTGNVCVWPSEEVMAYYCLQHIDDFRASNIIELGGGMTCLTGVALAVSAGAHQIVLTDGNEQSVSNLQEIIQENNSGSTAVSARLLRWGPEPVDHDLQGAFDCVLSADCLFFDEGREHLITTIYSLLKPGGQALVFAPRRNGTFDTFCNLAKTKFVTERCEQHDNHIWSLHSELKASSEAYSEDLHFPLLVKLTKQRGQDADSRDTTPESR
ncbi:calmodulin-lysine N-methyltransferase-like [Littorina saxatilis]|uniref:Calmodulin-lysine N-methyltransferase n=1 Tax=Littorina saxatilis TaxID=31220 RepID=A0AAN9GE33_9CAEN